MSRRPVLALYIRLRHLLGSERIGRALGTFRLSCPPVQDCCS